MSVCVREGEGERETYYRLVRRKHFPQAEHDHHKREEAEEVLAHGGPVDRARGRVYSVPDVHVEVKMYLHAHTHRNSHTHANH